MIPPDDIERLALPYLAMLRSQRSWMASFAILGALIAQLPAVFCQTTSTSEEPYWTITSYRIESVSTSYFTYDGTVFTATYGRMYEIAPTATPTASPTSTTTWSYSDYLIKTLYLPPGAVPESDIVKSSTYTAGDNRVTDFVVEVTYTAPSSCPTQFAITTLTEVYIPIAVRPHLTPTKTVTESGYITVVSAYLNPTDVPPKELNPTNDWKYTKYIEQCSLPPAFQTGTSSSDGGSSGSSSSGGGWRSGTTTQVCSVLTGCTTLRTWIIVVATLIPALFLLGFVESFLWFRRLMLGKSALRLGTVCWCLISLWFILLTRKQSARSAQDQAVLKEKWAALTFGQKIKYWFKWGFRHRYPVDLLGDPDAPAAPPADATGAVPHPSGPGAPPTPSMNGEKFDNQTPPPQSQNMYMPPPYSQHPHMQPGQSYPPPQPGQLYPTPYQGAPPQDYAAVTVQGYWAPATQPGQPMIPPVAEMPGSSTQPSELDGQQQQWSQPPCALGPSSAPTGVGTMAVSPISQPTPSPPVGQPGYFAPPPPPGQQGQQGQGSQ
ncbi:uncharacterized protein CTHT_0049170 [Thermochaetoides thermophila DSM 1495]|uniref:Uncharacterized protein n=1 Tax=Chaetomium thermophilum (strain DSM 1495 / CBS 144.50 / IMI 039719) TaxID=759272 RepID=G0SB76_CHATD|nr:hypothetical protein CTHT_0049170 [Thermochaetoides thermophila DSM 1495]EGS19456.1 hypothetical protein CTHT_0049170 [Thermochaetoides thermophila DSM 1495]